MGSRMKSLTGRPVVNNLQTTTARQICTGEVVLMTLWVRIADIKRHKNVRVLLDLGSQRSYISESLAAEMGLPIVSKENVALALFGGSRTEPKLHNKYRIKLCSVSPRAYSSLEFEFLDQNVIH
ncbi:integrase catalytic domain-containing protein [Trichonephila clavipes]|nr:integrase catalytic domain-containing protein [Trichonephila clavipes]